MATTNSYFSDFDWSFTPHPKTGDITVLRDSLAVKRSLKNILLTKFSERRFYSDKGSGIYFNLFEPLDIISIRGIQNAAELAIQNYEPRINLQDVSIKTDSSQSGLYITLVYQIINSITIDTTTIFLERAR